jgi:hypothetical protein
MRFRLVLPILLMGLLPLGSCRRAPEISESEVVVLLRDRLPEGLEDPVWREAPLHPAPLVLQDLVEPRQMEVSTRRVDVQAVSDGRRVAFRLRWEDPTVDDTPGAARFSDACAVQLPAAVAADLPAPQMGEEGGRVEITYWSAAWQADVDGREDSIQALYPGATVDHYPFEAPSLEPGSPERREMENLYAPARALGNLMAGPRDRPVEDLIADGPGTLEPAETDRSEGVGRRVADGWDVLIERTIPSGLTPGGRSHVAFAVWEGSGGEVGARKMRSVWIPLYLESGHVESR